MDLEQTSERAQTGLSRFVEDLALCLAVHRDRSPAVVWPEGIDATVAGRGGELSELPTSLGALLGAEVTSSVLVLPVGGRSDADTTEGDLVLLPLKGSCGSRVTPSVPGQGSTVPEHTLELRLRVGEALYVPQSYAYTLNAVHIPCTLQILTLRPAVWRELDVPRPVHPATP
ncbi:hypothetical protein ACIBVL_23895 [Streptomyces sp. NPDC049687]|uniref:hypothetical protein n=1 Tax=Streptomyces sp. NPDC049687 TaxID=3365596 RepID=UPI003796F128